MCAAARSTSVMASITPVGRGRRHSEQSGPAVAFGLAQWWGRTTPEVLVARHPAVGDGIDRDPTPGRSDGRNPLRYTRRPRTLAATELERAVRNSAGTSADPVRDRVDPLHAARITTFTRCGDRRRAPRPPVPVPDADHVTAARRLPCDPAGSHRAEHTYTTSREPHRFPVPPDVIVTNASAAWASRDLGAPPRRAARRTRSVSASRRFTNGTPTSGGSRNRPATIPCRRPSAVTERAACCRRATPPGRSPNRARRASSRSPAMPVLAATSNSAASDPGPRLPWPRSPEPGAARPRQSPTPRSSPDTRPPRPSPSTAPTRASPGVLPTERATHSTSPACTRSPPAARTPRRLHMPSPPVASSSAISAHSGPDHDRDRSRAATPATWAAVARSRATILLPRVVDWKEGHHAGPSRRSSTLPERVFACQDPLRVS